MSARCAHFGANLQQCPRAETMASGYCVKHVLRYPRRPSLAEARALQARMREENLGAVFFGGAWVWRSDVREIILGEGERP